MQSQNTRKDSSRIVRILYKIINTLLFSLETYSIHVKKASLNTSFCVFTHCEYGKTVKKLS